MGTTNNAWFGHDPSPGLYSKLIASAWEKLSAEERQAVTQDWGEPVVLVGSWSLDQSGLWRRPVLSRNVYRHQVPRPTVARCGPDSPTHTRVLRDPEEFYEYWPNYFGEFPNGEWGYSLKDLDDPEHRGFQTSEAAMAAADVATAEAMKALGSDEILVQVA